MENKQLYKIKIDVPIKFHQIEYKQKISISIVISTKNSKISKLAYFDLPLEFL